MHGSWLYDVVRAEVAYRTEEIYRSWPAEPKRRRRLLGRRSPEIHVPRQRGPSADESTVAEARAG
ncbi:hypothetical protein [Amycolatopsis pithecellobii]|uniref:Uncharacterized protein n=1 Tax=Amycolatopsis pithecellobii TaxID=664692 RepID=A0A6N7YKP2_9PSEU|nr:hypothetical protein [Amycolatopsis pithecellobii]MTD53485.1 hypothetical protein [Amycolatopsis pithecellobii]